VADVKGATKIDAKTARSLQVRGVVFVDVRAASAFGREHIPGAANLDLQIDLSKETLSRLVGKNDEVVFACYGKYCPYSAFACAKALTWGFTRVYCFAGGFPAWKEAGYPVEGSSGL
jgi:adenylate cyclase